MALTAARTELNVSLVGEDETIRMLEDAKKRMAELERQTRSLTTATRSQADAAVEAEESTRSFSDRARALGGRLEGVQERVDGFTGKIKSVIETFGDVGDIITGAISAFEFLSNAFDDSEEKAAELEKQMARNKRQADSLKRSTDALADSLNRMRSATGQGAVALGQLKVELAELEGDTELAAFEAEGVTIEQAKLKLAEYQQKKTEFYAEDKKALEVQREAESELNKLREQAKTLEAKASLERSKAMQSFNKEEHRAAAALADFQRMQLLPQIAGAKTRLNLAVEQRKEGEKYLEGLNAEMELTDKIVKKRLQNLSEGKDLQKDEGGGGGGGGGGRGAVDTGPTPEELAEQAKQRREFYHEFRLEELDEEKKHQRRMALAGLGEDNLSALRTTRDAVAAELASLPQGAMAAAFAPLRTELEKRLTELDGLAKQHAQMGIAEYFDPEQADKVLSAWEAEQKAIEQVNAALSALGETRIKAAEESARLAEQLERENLAGYVDNFKGALEALSEVQTPAFEAISASLAGVSAQMGKFKDGQQSLTAAIVGSAGAIAGAVADKVASVRVEAGIRALFETAMGFATLGNPAESVGHFTAAAMFGLVAGGVIPTGAKAGAAAGGQKAPAKETMATRDKALSGGGGQVTNVYNLNTGIVDGQSTAMAFRRAEMQARNTGMASAGGW